MTQPVEKIEDIPNYPSVGALKRHLTINGCRLCSLGFQPQINGCCVARGSEMANKMIIGEAPGKEEDATGKPFSGPAGQLMDDIWGCVGLDTNDWYVTNVCLCRPYMARGSGKENFTPKVEQRRKCRPYLKKQIELLKPKLIVTLGAVATSAFVDQDRPIKIGDYRGRLLKYNHDIDTYIPEEKIENGHQYIFPMLHPAAILHAKGSELYDLYRQQTWDDVKQLKQILQERGI